MYYVYVDPVNGSDTPTGARKSTNAATAAASPWRSLLVAEAQERVDGNTLADSLTFRLLAGVDACTTNGGVSFANANWGNFYSAQSTRFIYLAGYGTGVHDGLRATTNGYTLNKSGGSGFAFTNDNVNMIVTDIRILETAGNNDTIRVTGGNSRFELTRCLVFGDGGNALYGTGGNASTKYCVATNCVLSSSVYRGAYGAASGNANSFILDHCTIIGNHATEAACSITTDAQTIRYCYIGNRGAGAAGGGTGWAGSTKALNVTHDTSGNTQNVAISTTADSTHAGFTNITANTENFDIKVGSPLIDVVTSGSTTADDILGRTRPGGTYRDAGAFEYQAVASGSLIRRSRNMAGGIGTGFAGGMTG